MATVSQMEAVLKEDYKEYWETLNQASFALSEIVTKRDTVDGRRANHLIHTKRSGAIGARRDGVALPPANRQSYKSVLIPLRWVYGRIELSLPFMKQAVSGSGAFLDAMESEMKGIRNDAARDMCRQVWGTSNGVIATCGTTTASTTVQLAATTTASQMRHLYENRVVDIGTVASPTTVASARTITAFDATNKTITISGAAVTTSAIHFVFNTSSGGASDNTGNVDDGQSEMTGLQTIVSNSGTLHTVDPSTYSVWKAQVNSNSGTNRPLSEPMIDYMLLNNGIESGTNVNRLVSNVGVFLAGKVILSAYQRNIETMTFNGGFQGIKWSTPGVGASQGAADSIGWACDFDCPENKLFGLNTTDGLVAYELEAGWNWMDDDGAILSRVAGYPSYEATLYKVMEVGCTRRNAHFLISDISEVTG